MGFTLTNEELKVISDSAIEGVANRINSIAGYIDDTNNLPDLLNELEDEAQDLLLRITLAKKLEGATTDDETAEEESPIAEPQSDSLEQPTRCAKYTEQEKVTIKALLIVVMLSSIAAGFVIGSIIAGTKEASEIYYEEMGQYEN